MDNPRVPITGASLTFPLPTYYAVVRSETAYLQGEPFNRQGQGNSADSTGVPGSAAYKRHLTYYFCEQTRAELAQPGARA